MSWKWWGDFISLLADPVYGKLIISAIIILVAWLLTLLVNGVISRWDRIVESRAGQDKTVVTAPARTRFAIIRRLDAADKFTLGHRFAFN